jgi:hypothetical protein
MTVEERINESGQNVTYLSTGRIAVTNGDAPRVFNIILTREQST